jgi:acyl transferase domain-containing protein/NAD(P)-dependent dehydrogenase (short-subunit alcohol dehydrogenase family)/acyl carrier protein
MGGVQQQFEILGLSPGDAAHAGIAVAVARAGGIGLLDLGLCRNEAAAERNFRQLCETAEGRIGLRVTAASADLAMKLLVLAPQRPLTLIFAGAPTEQARAVERIAPATHHYVLAEIVDPAQAKSVPYAHAGIVAKGHEAGGWVGADTSYILAQKLVGKIDRPVYMQGGIGIHGAAGLRALGAAGVVLDDQLLLLAESPLPVTLQNELSRLNGAETRLFGELLDAPCRVYARPNATALKAADDEARAADAGTLPLDEWRTKLTARMGWDTASLQSGEMLMPLGQAIGMAATYRNQYRSVARLVNTLRRESLKHIETAAKLEFLAPGGPLAQSHGTRFPLCQGPMTRVSDSAEFAYQVSRNGGLPFLALALMRGNQVKELLEQTRAKMGDLPWGVGLLGFLPHSMLEEQCNAIWECKPTYALLAGGRPDQASKFESRGIPTYIHAPAPALLKMYIEQGAKRFVFEGRECGGHVGPLTSFPLWEQMIELLLAEIKPGTEGEYHLLFAGGIHDARSGAMLAALTAPLAARGIKIGALMGTAYLFTKEIVESGAIVQGFQEQALACERTVNLESGPGHATRCADTPFARDFYETRKRLLREGRSSDEIRLALEELNLGRLRIASKGVNRGTSGDMVEVDAAGQYAEGMYMIGQVATIHDRVQPIEELHLDVTEGACSLLHRVVDEHEERAMAAQPCDIAIIGIGLLLPRSHNGETFWENTLDQVNVITEVPKTRFDASMYFDPDRRSRETIYSKWGGFLEEIPFNPLSYGIPPKSMKSIDPMQLLALETARLALADAGLDRYDFDRENTSVILGAGGGAGELGVQYSVRSELPRWVENPSPEVWERLPKWTAESFAGCLLNVVAGRIANRMDFGGLNFTVDAACASSLAAVAVATNELASGRSSVCIAGGLDTGQGPSGFLCFSKTQALSPNGKLRSFDASADGIVTTEGFAMVVMKRLADAERDGDRIYAVIKAVGGSSDGKAMGMTAPRPEGQMRALKRAYAKAGISPATIGLIEAHGTGTAVGDKAEAKTMTTVMLNAGAAPHTAAIGSVKSLIGHTKGAAGVIGLIKVAQSLYHRTLPGHYGVEKPIDLFADPTSPVYLLKDARPWLSTPEHPRRAATSAFGFGGTNFHAVVEEYRGGIQGAAGADRWPFELFVLRAADEAALATEAGRIATALRQGTNIKLRDLAFSLARQAETRRGAAVSLAIVAKDFSGLIADLEAAIATLQGKSDKPLPKNIHLGRGLKAQAPSVAFLFPGQGSQYVNMGTESALYIEELRSALELADVTLRKDFPTGLSRLIMPAAAFDPATEKAQTAALTDTRVAQPAIGTLSLGYLRFAERLGLNATAAAGHSYGEYSALCAAGVIAPADLLRLSAVRGRCMAEATKTSQPGAMAAIQAKRDVVAKAIEGLRGVRIANHNAPEQSVISGAAAEVEDAAKKLEAAGVRVTRLPVSGAFHTELVAGAQEGLSAAIRSVSFRTPRFTVYSNTTGAAYPTEPREITRVLEGHLLNSVEFVAEVEAMYAAGCRVFVELGPKGTLSNMAKQILAGRDAITVSLDGSGGGIRGLLLGLAELTAAGVDLALTRLFDGREAKALELNRLAELVKPVEYSKSTWWVSGGCARPFDDPIMRNGSLPQLDSKAVTEARAKAEADKRAVEEARKILASPPPAPAAVPALPVAGMPPALPATPTAAMWNNEALAAYQQTMRQFLNLQERVIQQFLGTGGAPMDMPAMPAIPMPAVPAPATVTSPTAPVPAAAKVGTPAPAAKPAAAPAPAVAAAATPVPAPAAAPALDVRAALMEIVAERTGYPQEMLGLDQDMEAELGIDSIKRVEILGALQKLLPANVGEAMQGSMEKFIQAKTLRAVIDLAQADLARFGGAAATAAAPAPVAAPATAAPASPAAAPLVAPTAAPAAVVTLDRPALQAQLLAIVSERTGYPPEMLGLDQDMEAELGIDSIKRVEILGALQKVVPENLGAAMQASMEQFIGARSLNAVLDVALMVAAAAPATAAPAPAPAAAPAPTVPPAAAVPAAPAVASTPAPTPAPAAAAPIVLDRAALKDQLLAIVSERTGYPTDMLGMDQDLEAELGIDSIKRVEILGALQKVVPESLGAAMQASMEQFIGARSLNAVLDAALAIAAAAPAAAAPATVPAAAPAVTAPAAAATPAVTAPAAVAAAAPAPVAAAGPITLDRAALKDQLLAIVSERTGYPTDMLGMDQDLEAELGIDSIKRVEILGALQKVVPESLGAAMQASMEQFIGARSLNAVLEVAANVAASAGKPAAPEPAPATPAPAPTSSNAAPATPAAAAPASADTAAANAVQRLVVRMRPAPLPTSRQSISGLYIITADSEGVAQRVADRVVGAGGFAAVVPIDIAADPGAIKDTVSRLRAQHGAVRGVVHLAGLQGADASNINAWHQATRAQVKALFFLLQQAATDFAAGDSVALSASRFGGSLGREAHGRSEPLAGAAVGLFNCAIAEWPKLRARLVDFEDGASADFVADALFDELTVVDRRPEVGYRGNERVSGGYVIEPLVDHPFAPHLEPSADWVMLITGGARGITAEIAEELVRPGMRVALVGRTPLPGPEGAVTASLTDTAALKKGLLQAALSAGRKPTPKEIDGEVKAVLANREIRANVARLSARGAMVDYRSCDVRDTEAFGALIDGLYAQYGRIDAVLHGAGVIEDKRIADKAPESFDRVFETKVDSTFVLARKLKPEGLKLLSFFTSVAGRFGNVGQGDYGAANETLNRFAWQLHHAWPRVRVVSINWGPWDAGMATDTMRAAFKAMGIVPVSIPGGRRFFVDELALGGRNDVELVAGEGPWTQFAEPASSAPAAPPVVQKQGDALALPLVRKPIRIGVGGSVVLEHRLTLSDDPYLADHIVDGKPVLPAAAAAEYIAQFVAAGYPEWQVTEIRDVRQLAGIILEGDAPRDIMLRARSSTHSDIGTQAVTVEIVDPLRKFVPFYRATVLLAQRLPDAPQAANVAPISDGEPMDTRTAYADLLFHGTRFRLISKFGRLSMSGADAEVMPSSPESFLGPQYKGSRWLFDPGLLDAAPQIAHLCAITLRDKGALPSRFGKIARYGNEPLTGPLRLVLREKTAPHEHAIIYDAQIIDQAGRVRLAIFDGESTMSASLKRLAPKFSQIATGSTA